MKQCSETSTQKIQTPGNRPKIIHQTHYYYYYYYSGSTLYSQLRLREMKAQRGEKNRKCFVRNQILILNLHLTNNIILLLFRIKISCNVKCSQRFLIRPNAILRDCFYLE